jgi:hypothetical protein
LRSLSPLQYVSTCTEAPFSTYGYQHSLIVPFGAAEETQTPRDTSPRRPRHQTNNGAMLATQLGIEGPLMARGEVWYEFRTLFGVGALRVVEARLVVAQDDGVPLPVAFRMLISLRILGAQLDDEMQKSFAVSTAM